LPENGSTKALDGLFSGAAHEHFHQITLIIGRAAIIVHRIDLACGNLAGFSEDIV
jgi:hypothetical protein